MNQYDEARKYIKRCFEIAKRGRGHVSPNPMVGAVIVKEGNVIAEGWHDYYGGPHAEVAAFMNAKEDVKGATLYVNLEPCCHEKKKTPPCTDIIIEKGIDRVVICNTDPNPLVNGQGIEKLRVAGIEVISGIYEEEGERLNRFFFKFVQTKIPYITLKIAQTLDGKISRAKGEQTWITGRKSGNFVHKYRATFDAVLVGAQTIIDDNPLLNVRKVSGRNPIRAIIDGKFRTSVDANVYTDGGESRTMVFTITKSNPKKIGELKRRGVNVIELAHADVDKLQIEDILKYLGKQKISSLLVEGGNKIFSQFVQSELFDEIVVLQAPKIFGHGIDAFDFDTSVELDLHSVSKLGDDIKMEFHRRKE